MKMLVSHRVVDFKRWYEVLEANRKANHGAGLGLEQIWRKVDDPNQFFFLLSVEDRERAEQFMATPESAEAGKAAGVLEGEVYFVEEFERD